MVYLKSNVEKEKGIQDDQGVERRMGEKPRASHISPETLDISDSDQSDLKLDSADVTTRPTTCDPTKKLIPTCFKILIKI